MFSKINKIAVIGTGVIGSGWIIRMLAHNKKVIAFDVEIKQKKILLQEIKRSIPFVKKLFKIKDVNLKNLSLKTSLTETLYPQAPQDYYHQLFFQNVKILVEVLLAIRLIQFICYQQLKL